LVPLTLRKSRRIVTMRKADNSIREKRAGPPRLALICAAQPDISPVDFGGNVMSRIRGSFGSFLTGHSRGIAHASGGLLALALSAGLWLGAAQAQETRIIDPGSLAVTGFSGTIIPNIDQGLPPGVDPVDETFID